MMGFKVPDVAGDVAPEIKPGMVIDSNKYKDYPGLDKLLPKSLYLRLDSTSYAPLAPIKIVKTDQYHLSRGFLEHFYKSAQDILYVVSGTFTYPIDISGLSYV